MDEPIGFPLKNSVYIREMLEMTNVNLIHDIQLGMWPLHCTHPKCTYCMSNEQDAHALVLLCSLHVSLQSVQLHATCKMYIVFM